MRRLGPHHAFLWKPGGNPPMKTRNPHVASEPDVGSSCKKAKIINEILNPHEKSVFKHWT